MKTMIKMAVVSAVMTLTLTSCFESFLEEKVYDFISPTNFYKTEADALAAINSTYNPLVQGNESFNRAMMMMGEYPAESSTAWGSGDPYRTEFEQYTWNENSGGLEGVWLNCYRGINRANILLEQLPNIEANDEIKRRIEGESRFLRAFYYFFLIRTFEEVPLTTISTEPDYLLSNEGNSEKIFELIISDLKSAKEMLPTSYTGADIGRATKGAASAILAKVYLTQSGIPYTKAGTAELALTELESVISSYGYDLMDNFGDVFTEKNEHGKEYIFAAENKGGLNGSNWVNMTCVRGQWQTKFEGWTSLGATKDFYLKVIDQQPEDKRIPTLFVSTFTDYKTGKEVTWGKDFDPNQASPHTNKYVDVAETGTGNGQSSLNVQLIRFADVLLMHTEAANRAGSEGSLGKYYGINKVRARAGLAPLAGLSKEQLDEAIVWERVVEFCFEGQAWFDYKRMGVMEKRAAIKGYNAVSKKHYSYPIPQNEINRNPKLVQHPNWE